MQDSCARPSRRARLTRAPLPVFCAPQSITGSAVVTNSVFLYNSVNRATTGAGGLYVGSTTANVTISSCTFTQNQVPGFGAGLFIDSIPLTGSVAVVDSTFSFNVAQYGGARQGIAECAHKRKDAALSKHEKLL